MDDKLQRVVDVMYEYRQKGVGLEDKAKSIVQMFESERFVATPMSNFGKQLEWAPYDAWIMRDDALFLAELTENRALVVVRYYCQLGELHKRDGEYIQADRIVRMAELPDLGMEW